MFFSNAGDRGRGMRVPHGTDRIPGGCLRATARSGNYQPRGNRRDRPIGPFLPCRQGARTKEGDIRANSNAGAGGGLDSDSSDRGTRLARSFGNGGGYSKAGISDRGTRQGRTAWLPISGMELAVLLCRGCAGKQPGVVGDSFTPDCRDGCRS